MKKKRNLYILCGGYSKRMKRDKALLEINGVNMIDHLEQRAGDLFNEVVLLTGQKQYKTNLRQLPDPIENAGPLSGILAALKDTQDDYAAIVAVDLPLISKKTLTHLSKSSGRGFDVIIAKSYSYLQPLAGLYHKSLANSLEVYLNERFRRVQDFLLLTRTGAFFVGDRELMNLNYPKDYNKITRELRP